MTSDGNVLKDPPGDEVVVRRGSVAVAGVPLRRRDRLPDGCGVGLDPDPVHQDGGRDRGRAHRGLQCEFEVGEGVQALRPQQVVLVDPPLVDQLDRDGVEEVQLLPPRPSGDDEARLLQHRQVLHNPEPGHVEALQQLRQRAAVTREELVQEVPAGGVGQCLEHLVVAVLVHTDDHR